MTESKTPELPPLLPEDREAFYAHMNQIGLTLKQADALYGSSLAYGVDCYAAGIQAGMEKAAGIAESDEFYGGAVQHAIAAAIRAAIQTAPDQSRTESVE